MDLKLYNTLTRTKERFDPIDASNVRMYVCGPTVYDDAHIGNARPVIVFDVLFRLLRHLYGADHVTYARNITDVDDKIIERSLRDGIDIADLTQKTTAQFHADVKALGCLEPTHEPRATDYVVREDHRDMVSMIATLIARGHAYAADGHVLFDTASMPDYGRLANRTLDEMVAGARVEVASYKKNATDFVLWKPSSEDQPGWPSPWGRGRPGWHIECSAMSAALLGETFDIHGGGIDLAFPHHENELAQSRCAHGSPVMANVWIHNGFLQVEGQKMSKSLGNFVTINELLHTDKFGGWPWPGLVMRFAMLKTHYRQPINWSVALLEQASMELTDLVNFASSDDDAGPSPMFLEALCDDLNMPKAIAEMHRLAGIAKGELDDFATRSVRPGGARIDAPGAWIAAEQLAANLKLVGIPPEKYNPNWLKDFRTGRISFELQDRVERSITARQALIADKNWAEADRIRDELLAQGIQLKDGKDPETGARVTTWEVVR